MTNKLSRIPHDCGAGYVPLVADDQGISSEVSVVTKINILAGSRRVRSAQNASGYTAS